MCHPERKNAKRFGVEVLRRRSKTKERSDEGVSQQILLSFPRKLILLYEEKRLESLSRPRRATHAALPWVGFDCEKHPTGIFFSAQGDTKSDREARREDLSLSMCFQYDGE